MAHSWAGGGTAKYVELSFNWHHYLVANQAPPSIQILPWDSDSDVQVSEASMHFLASYYNMTIFRYRTPRIPEGRDYMLEVNPHYVVREQSDKLNVIDARWIDMSSGLFIDITTARYAKNHPAGKNIISCKDGHEYRVSHVDCRAGGRNNFE